MQTAETTNQNNNNTLIQPIYNGEVNHKGASHSSQEEYEDENFEEESRDTNYPKIKKTLFTPQR
jgi:hypothetical protein